MPRLSRLEAPPEIIGHGLRSARLSKGGTYRLCATDSLLKAMDGRRKVQERAKQEFHVPFASAVADGWRIAADRRESLCREKVTPPAGGPRTHVDRPPVTAENQHVAAAYHRRLHAIYQVRLPYPFHIFKIFETLGGVCEFKRLLVSYFRPEMAG